MRQDFYWPSQQPSQENDFQLKISSFSKGILHLLRPCIRSCGFALKALKTLWEVFWELLGFPSKAAISQKLFFFIIFNRKKTHKENASAAVCGSVALLGQASAVSSWYLELLQSPVFQTSSAELFPKSSCSPSCKSFLPSSNQFCRLLKAMQNQVPLFWHHLSLVRREKKDNCLQVSPFLLLVFPVTWLSQCKT